MEKDEWEVSNHQMLERRNVHSCLYMDDKLIVVGGWATKTNEIFDLNQKSWRYGNELPKSHIY